MDDVSSTSGISGPLTPGDLLALVQDNARHHENLLSAIQASDLDTFARKLTLIQDIIDDLSELPRTPIRNIELASQVRHALAERRSAVTKAQRQLAEVEQDIGQMLGEYRSLLKQREQRLSLVWQAYLQQPEFAGLMRQRDELLDAHSRLDASLARIAEERDRKMPAYDGNPFYVHLRRHRYATDDYVRSKLMRRFDDWLATKVNYRENRRNELILRSMPDSVSRLLDGYKARLQAIDEQNIAAWNTDIGALRGDATALRSTLLIKQIIAAKQRANSAYEELTPFIDGDDEHANEIGQWLDTQLRDRDLYDVLEKLIERNPDDRDGFDRHWEALNTVNTQIEDLEQRGEQAFADYEHAKELEWSLRSVRASEAICEETCTCACHNPGGMEGQCPCLYRDERYYTYPAGLDWAELIGSYMKRNLALEDLTELFDSQRQSFIEERPPEASAPAHITRDSIHS